MRGKIRQALAKRRQASRPNWAQISGNARHRFMAMVMNKRTQSVHANRREFLRSGIRYALLAGVAAVSAALVVRRDRALPNQTCINQGICRGCGMFDDCGLPQALSAKQTMKGGGT